MKFTRAQELKLIHFGFQKVLEMLDANIPTKPRKTKKAWSTARRKRFSKTMKAKWAEKA